MRNRDRSEASEFLKGLSRALGRIISSDSLVSLEETDRLLLFIAKRWPSLRPTARKTWLAGARSDVQGATTKLASAFPDREVFYLGTPSKSFGAVRIGLRTALERALPLVDCDGDDLWLIDPGLENALVLEWVEDFIDPADLDEGRGWQYDLHVRGSEWVRVASFL